MLTRKFHRCEGPADCITHTQQSCLCLERCEFPCYEVGCMAVDSLKNGCPALRLSSC